jgi:hypothetical protein
MNKCKVCGNEFNAVRKTALYCSTKCKLAYHRDSVSEVSVSKSNIVDSYKGFPITAEGQEALKDPDKFLRTLIDAYPANVLFKLGLLIPKWKKSFATHSEALAGVKAIIDKKFKMSMYTKEPINYDTWK